MTEAKVIWELPDEDIEWKELHAKWETVDQDNFIDRVRRGREGLNEGLDNGLNRINKYIHGTHRGRYYLIGADSGVGKTTICDFMYLFSIWMACRKAGVKLYIKYFSFEISAAEKKAKWVCQWIKRIYNIDLSADYVMGRIPGKRLTDEHFKMVLRAYGVVEEMMKDIEIIDHLLHPTGMLNTLIENHYEKIGTVIRDTPKEGKKKGMIRGYKGKDPTAVTLAVVDHMALINIENGATVTKQIMDRWSLYSVQLRNIFGTILINIQQFSTSMMSAYREQKKTEAAIAPQRLDFGDSTYTYRDADVVFGLVKPIQFSLPMFQNFNLREELGTYFLALYLMKNRYGPADRVLPLFINPLAGMFWDLPESSADPSLKFYNDEAKRLDQLL